MSEESKGANIKVGIFVFIGSILLAITTLMLGEESPLFTDYYPLKVHFKYVQGLRNGSVVSLSGLKAGNVNAIEFIESKNILEVTLSIKEELRDRFREGSLADVRTQGALGDKYIFIEPGPLSNPVIKAGSIIPSKPENDIFSMITEKGSEIDRFFDILKEIQSLLKSINNTGRNESIMTNLHDTSKEMKSFVAEAKKLTLDIRKNLPQNGEFKKSSARLASIMEKIDRGDGTLGALINDPTLHERINELLGGKPRHQQMKSLIRKSIERSDLGKQ